jgi:plasmid stabilization system protein ParE
MAAQQTVKDAEFQLYTLAIQPVFWDTLQEILDFTLNHWGATVMYEFLKKINQSILSLNTTPHIYARCPHLVSAETKTYRNIILKKYPYTIIYSIEKNKVTVLNILHTSRNPQAYKKLTQQTRSK